MCWAGAQGPGTDEASLRELREAIRDGRACVVQLMNYKRNGDAFVNYLSVTPIHDSDGVLTHYVGIQADITELVNHKKAELAAKHAAVQARALPFPPFRMPAQGLISPCWPHPMRACLPPSGMPVQGLILPR